MNINAIMVTSQKIPPLRKSHPACKKSKSFPKRVQEYAEEAHAIKITIIKRVNPPESSSHLFMGLDIKIYLKRFCFKNIYFSKWIIFKK